MKALRQILLILIVVAVTGGIPLSAQEQAQESSVVRQVLEKIVSQEQQLVKNIANYSPRVETYVQEIHVDSKDGSKSIAGDDYFFGRLKVQDGVIERTFLPPPPHQGAHRVLNAMTVYKPFLHAFSFKLEPNAFAHPILVDPAHFDLQHYRFEFFGREFLGEVRCLVFNVVPIPHAGQGLFRGRIWVEDQGYNIVRINGVYGPHGPYDFHFDSWRENLQPGLWLPVYVYSEESDLARYDLPHLGFKSQTRLWGYVLKASTPDQELTRILVDSQSSVQDNSDTSHDASPLASQRNWRREAEDNILNRLQKSGMLAPPGDVDKVLETVVNNLVVTNHLDNLPPIRCRVLLSDPLESLTIGDTIILSRGLVDVMPDEASLAMALGHELGHIVLGDTIDTKYAFHDRMMISDEDVLKKFDFAHTEQSEDAADKKALELLENSPYKDKLAQAGLFLRALAEAAPHMPNLFGSHLGTRLIQGHQQLRMGELAQNAPALQKNSLEQIAALPLGARIKINAWDDQITLMKTQPVTLVTAKDKMPFEITPLVPYLTHLKPAAPEQARR